jgi:hypothetical protein
MWLKKMYLGLHVKYQLFLSDFKDKRIFLDRFLKSTHISNFMKICPMEAELFHMDGRPDGQNEEAVLRMHLQKGT